ncbi:MAG: NAD-binding protein [Chloroflexi bacterium]|nr:NAD-binding protein [Chloroflexota bacterium]
MRLRPCWAKCGGNIARGETAVCHHRKKSAQRRGLRQQGIYVIEGDATHDAILYDAGVERAWGLIVCSGEDSINLFVVLSARAIKPDLFIIARSIEGVNEAKMRLAGANRVISPYQIGGRHMAIWPSGRTSPIFLKL